MHHNIPHSNNKERGSVFIRLILQNITTVRVQHPKVGLQVTGVKPSRQHFHFHLIRKIDSQRLVYPVFGYPIASRDFGYQIVNPEIGNLIDSRDFAIPKFSIRMLALRDFVSRRPHSWSSTLYLGI